MDRKRFVIDQIVICQAIIGVCWMQLKLNQKTFSSWKQPSSVKLIPSNSHPEVNSRVFERTRKQETNFLCCPNVLSEVSLVLWYELGLMMPAPVGFGQREPIFLPLDLWCRGTPEFEDQRWCFTEMIQMGDYLILPPTRSSWSWSLSPCRPAAALETNWGAWLQGLGNELVHQVGRRVWIIWLLYFQERERTIYK